MRNGHIYRNWIDARYFILDTSNEYVDSGANLGINMSITKQSTGFEFVISRFSLVIYLGYIERSIGSPE